MKTWRVFNLLLLLSFSTSPAYCQGMAEFGATRSLPAGLGAGLAASYGNHSTMIKNSYKTIINAQQSALEQTKAIEKYMKYGNQLEAQKNWKNAELAFVYVLQIISRRDGPGSTKSLPALEHLVSVTKAEDKLADAIKYQRTIVAFKKAQAAINPLARINAEDSLSSLYVQNNDYKSAASVLQESVTYCNSQPRLSATAKHSTLSSYAKVLRKLHKDEEAQIVESKIAEDRDSATKEANANGENKGNDKDSSITKSSIEALPPVKLEPVPIEQPKTEQK